MLVARHTIDDEFMAGIGDMADRAFVNMPVFLESSRESARRLGSLSEQAFSAAALEHVANPASPRIDAALLLAVAASHSFFGFVINSHPIVFADCSFKISRVRKFITKGTILMSRLVRT